MIIPALNAQLIEYLLQGGEGLTMSNEEHSWSSSIFVRHAEPLCQSNQGGLQIFCWSLSRQKLNALESSYFEVTLTPFKNL